VSGLLPEPSGYAELLAQLKARVRTSQVRVARAAKTTCRGVPGDQLSGRGLALR